MSNVRSHGFCLAVLLRADMRRASSGGHAHFRAYLRDEAISVPNKSLSSSTNIETNPKNMPTNFEHKRERLKPKLDNVAKPENQVDKLTDSKGPE